MSMTFIKGLGVRDTVHVCMPESHGGVVVECDVTLRPYGADPDVRVLRWHTDSGNREWDTWQPAATCPVSPDDADNELNERAEMAAFEACGDGGPRGLAEDAAACAGDERRAERKDEGRAR